MDPNEFVSSLKISGPTVVVLRGPRGVGKSTLAKAFRSRCGDRCRVVVAAELPPGRGATFAATMRLRSFLDFADPLAHIDVIVVDGGDETAVDIAPYIALAPVFGYVAWVVNVTRRGLWDVDAEGLPAAWRQATFERD